MHTYYKDILSRIPETPKWFDEAGVPRFDAFEPLRAWNIYAREAALLEIRCQACEHVFHVCLTWSAEPPLTLAESVRRKSIRYGDPPNIGCCATGPTMTSIPRRVLQYWARSIGGDWERAPELEQDVTPDWAKE